MRKSLLAMTLAAVAAFTAACGNSDNEGSSPEPAASGSQQAGTTSGENVELKFMTWGNQQHLDMYQTLLAKYKETHPNITVTLESVPFADYQQKVSVLAAGRELPDLAWISERMVPQFMSNNILADISDIKNDAEFALNDFIPSTLELFSNEGGLYGLPFSTPPSVIFYNADLFEKAGLPTPNELASKGEWTWDKFVETAKTLTSGSGADKTYGATFFRDWKTWIMLPSYSWSNGSDIFNDDMTEFTWNDQYGVESLEMLKKMMFEDGSHPKAGEQISFDTGKLAMYFDGYSYMSKAREIKDFKWSIAPFPSGSLGSAPMMGQAGYVIFEQTKHPEEAKELLKFLASQEGVQATSTYFVPPRQSVLNSDSFLNKPNNPPAEHIKQALIDEMPKAIVQPGHVQWTKIDNEILLGFDRLFAESASPSDILAKMKQAIDPLLTK
ncbi:ABC transporter substrate-binding protein [Cohnella thailandensis]|uniref:Sugar ABC transporter substrate-binding protein n=1 Tax=Cohnella thailandensis TaxID=557557 RepID=A0A841T888_9BACL|nr:sugar ABC transporter substrate-binding protein [Cohnella thailandensis]MBB6637391.1 sugar ABC transporter substrate-binding protein [Cohnella thailandensis]MBP1976720.1 multiple sugar transport system substrate-binding protein [Cohnella thailandensis]